MYLRRCGQSRSQKDHVYWELVENQRTGQGPRQRVVAYLGDVDEAARIGIKQAALHNSSFQGNLFREDPEPEWVEVDVKRIRVEGVRDFGGYWIGLQIWDRLGLNSFLNRVILRGREEIPWSAMAGVLVLMRLCDPSSELRIAEHLYERTALGELLGISSDKVNEDRLYRALDELLPHKAELEKHLKDKLGELFGLKYDLLLYDITSTYFEGESALNPQARHGYSRDHRSDCRQVCIALVVSHWGIPLGYEVFGGNRADATTLEEIVEKVEAQYGRADRVWVMDRGMISEENLQFLRAEGRRYIVGTAKSQLRRFERQLLNEDWQQVHEGLEVKLCKGEDGEETFILCRSASRSQKEKAIHERFEKRIEEGLNKLSDSCRKRKQRLGVIERRVGRLLGANSRAAGLFQVDVKTGENGGAVVVWNKVEAWREWAQLSEGCYLLRSNINDWTGEQLWKTYIQLSEAEAAFRIHKGDLQIRPIWHQTEERVHSHILVCFLAYVAWKTLGQMCKRAGLGDEPRKVLDEIAQLKIVDVILPTSLGINIKKTCISQPTKHQAILLDRLGLSLPQRLEKSQDVVSTFSSSRFKKPFFCA